MHILLVNDDGIQSRGLRLLAQALQGEGHTVTVTAPDRQRSAVGHGITVWDPPVCPGVRLGGRPGLQLFRHPRRLHPSWG